MGHKVHPKIFRIRRIEDWESRGFYKGPAEIFGDFKIREYLEKKIGKNGIERIEIERFPRKINIIISSARPGLIIKRGGEGVEILKNGLEKILDKKNFYFNWEKKDFTGTGRPPKKEAISSRSPKKGEGKREIRIEIREVKNPWTSANLSAQWIAQQIEKRVPYRKVLKQVLSKIMSNKEVQGVKVEVSGRLNGIEIARREWLKEGSLPLQTIRADIDYTQTQAYCTYGTIGIKVWIYKGEKFE